MNDYSTLHSLISSLRDDDCTWEEIADFLVSVMDDVHEEEELAEDCGDADSPIEDLSWDDLFNQIILPWTAANLDTAFPLTDEEISSVSSSTLDFFKEIYSAVAAARKICSVASDHRSEGDSSTYGDFFSLMEKIFNRDN